jgi:hypothetical protein
MAVPAEDGTATDPSFELPPAQEYMLGRWEERNWRNVPGPFYGALTDNCWTGRLVAPAHILYDDEEHSREFVYRQPRSDAEVRSVLLAAVNDPYSGYACGGNEHWTTETVRAWWSDRGRVQEWIGQAIAHWSSSQRQDERKVIHGLRDYAQYIAGDLRQHLREYTFWLDRGRTPLTNEYLPELN